LTDAVQGLATALADRYRIERELGQGGMATVYLAQDLKHDRKVAVKVLKPELAAVLGAARAYLGGDSGVSHLAATVGAPSVVLFPSATARRWTPWSPTAIPVELQGEDADVERAREALARVLD